MNYVKHSLFLFILTLSMASSAKQKPNQCFLTDKTNADKVIPTQTQSHRYQVIARYPHDKSAFTQGLVFYKENLYESTGLLGKSGVRKINLNNGQPLNKTHISDIYFGEGLTIFNHQLVQMSWKSGKVFFFNPETLALIKQLNFAKEAWGNTVINNQLLISDGSSNLLFINPENFNINSILKITMHDQEISGLNELEYAEGSIYANVWPSSCIVKIDPASGKVTGWLDLSGLLPKKYPLPESAVLNGIAYQKQTRHFFVTGKFWPYIYEIKLQSNEH